MIPVHSDELIYLFNFKLIGPKNKEEREVSRTMVKDKLRQVRKDQPRPRRKDDRLEVILAGEEVHGLPAGAGHEDSTGAGTDEPLARSRLEPKIAEDSDPM